MKALNVLYIYRNTEILHGSCCKEEHMQEINEAIAELEEAMKPVQSNSCYGCKYGDDDRYWLCLECVRFYKSDRYEPKETK